MGTAAANDERGLFNASKSDYFEKDDNGNIKYNTFNPGNAVKEALANLATDGFKEIGEQSTGTPMEVLERDFLILFSEWEFNIIRLKSLVFQRLI